MYNSILVSSCLFGSIYLCSKSLKLINQALLQNKLIIINVLTFVISTSMFVYNFSLVNWSYFKSLNN